MIRALIPLILFYLNIFGAEHVRIATYNVENLFDMHYDGNEYSEYIPNTSWQWNQKNYRKKLENIARVIVDIHPDIIALQEIESLQALKDLQKTLKRKGLYFRYRAIADAKNSTVKTALLSRFRIVSKREIRVNQSLRYRNILEVKVTIKGEPLYIFVNHWKSKSGPESMRVASAKALKRRIGQIGGVDYIIAGDLNSHYEEKKIFLRKRKHNDTNGITGINDTLQTWKNRHPVSQNDLMHCKSCSYNLWYELPAKQRWSHNFYGKKEALDHLIISPALLDGKGVDYVDGSFKRFIRDYLFHRRALYRWQRSRKHPKHHLGKGYSDHLPVFAEFTVR